MYQLAVEIDYDEEDIMLERSEQIIVMLASRMNLPMALLTMGTLITNFEVFSALVFEARIFEGLVERIKNEVLGSPAQAVLMWTIVTATDRPDLIDSNQLQPLIPYL